jgi:MOSC domain-containing protein YiiM
VIAMTVSERAAAAAATAAALGQIEGIFVAAAAGAPMQAREDVRAIAGVGLDGDRYAQGIGTYSNVPGGGRQATLLDAALIESLRAEHGIELSLAETRRNFITRGVDLAALVGKRLQIGEALCEVVRDCPPCAYLESLTRPGVLKAMVGRGGLRLEILRGGTIHVGDTLRLAE